jgi:ABC-type branched-subunit amino acid transport system substrate-binding protein
MLRRAFVLLAATVALAACVGVTGAPTYGGGPIAPAARPAPGGGRPVAILLPLTGAYADRGQAMLKAAQLALDAPGAPRLAVFDTEGTPPGAATAARTALAGGAALILGPLTSAETAAVAPLARGAGVPVLAFTNDPAQAQPGVWPLGITPVQQVRRLVAAAQAQGKSAFAGLLPESDFGHAMGSALMEAAPGATVRYYGSGMNAINVAARDVSGYASRRGPIDAQIRAARALETPEGRKQAQELAKQGVPPPPFDTLLLADSGTPLAEIASLLPYYDVYPGNAVKILGPAQWSLPDSGAGAFPGAWYAAPDPAARVGFDQAFTAKYGNSAPPLADLAFDAAAIARALDTLQGVTVAALTQAQGFAGADGLLVLTPDGHVRRGLAVFEVQRGGAQMIEPAPASPGAPGV